MATVRGGKYTAIVKTAGKPPSARTINAFLLDRYPVTVRQYLEFVQTHPEWRRSRQSDVHADAAYLRRWRTDSDPDKPLDAPVTEVSWFAARAYCRAQGKRLPMAAEWEYAALADERQADASRNPEFVSRILSWYASPSSTTRSVGSFRNSWGIYDMHGLIWEWVDDFNGEFTSGDSRGDNSQDESAFCGGSAINFSDSARSEYASFMRYAFRGSLRGNYTIDTLGFRCAKTL